MAGSAWKGRFDAEISRAESARASGNEGQARVCARRAAGFAIREFLAREDSSLAGPAATTSAFELLKMVPTLAGISPRARQAAERLLQPVGPGGVFPAEIDLVSEARVLAENLGLTAPGSPDTDTLQTS